jgi:hypothetical protein
LVPNRHSARTVAMVAHAKTIQKEARACTKHDADERRGAAADETLQRTSSDALNRLDHLDRASTREGITPLEKDELTLLRCLLVVSDVTLLTRSSIWHIADNLSVLEKLQMMERDSAAFDVVANTELGDHLDKKRLISSAMPEVTPLVNQSCRHIGGLFGVLGLSFASIGDDDARFDNNVLVSHADRIVKLCRESASVECRSYRCRGNSTSKTHLSLLALIRRESATIGCQVKKWKARGDNPISYSLRLNPVIARVKGLVHFRVVERDICTNGSLPSLYPRAEPPLVEIDVRPSTGKRKSRTWLDKGTFQRVRRKKKKEETCLNEQTS